mgnify:CR=1 FL=1
MAEVNIGGITFKGGKMLAVILALSSTVGVLYGGFEMFKKFQDMSAQIESYVAPDLSEFDKTIALTKEEMKSKTELIQTEVEMMMQEMRLVSDVANELKNDLRQDVRRVEKIVNDVEQQVKEDARDNSKDLKIAINTVEEDMTKLKTDLEEKMKELQESIDKQIKLTLANPLAQMTK